MDALLAKEGAIVVAALAASVLAGIRVAILSESPRGKIIKIRVNQSGLQPDQITLTRGEPVVLELAAIAVPFVFFAPGLAGNSTLTPGTPVRVQLKPEKTGEFEIWCVACDSAYPKLTGTLIVID